MYFKYIAFILFLSRGDCDDIFLIDGRGNKPGIRRKFLSGRNGGTVGEEIRRISDHFTIKQRIIQVRGNARKKWNDFAENACCNLLTIVYNTKKGYEKNGQKNSILRRTFYVTFHVGPYAEG